ncbi:hypothetical protein EVA_01128 [gut metagenome]|uniref:Uncharacterized protein n=1 Tax=gut metagenome TaxID=749906 RepID=J9GQB0_9ZZZZ
MGSCSKAVEEVVHHAEYMAHGEHGDDRVAGLHLQHFEAVGHVRPQAAVGQHHSLGVAGGARRVVDDGQFFRLVLAVGDVFGAEILGIALAVDGIAVFAGFNQLRVACHQQRKVVEQDDAFEQRHGLFVEVLPHAVAHKEQFGFGMVDNVVDVVRLEFVQDGHDDGPVGQCGQEGDCPVGTVASADGYFVSRLDACAFQYDVEFGYFACHIFILKGDSFVVCQGIFIPMLDDALFYVINEVLFLFHSIFAHLV